MGMLPMFSNMNIGQGMDKEGQLKMRKYMTMMDSMSEKELDETDARKLMDINRMKRIAYGSGTSLVCCCVRLPQCRFRAVCPSKLEQQCTWPFLDCFSLPCGLPVSCMRWVVSVS